MRIPRVFHGIWVGPAPIPERYLTWWEGWRQLHPNWAFRLWRDEDLPPARYPRTMKRCRWAAHLSDFHRLEVLYRHGGVYFDLDIECRRNLEPLVGDLEFFAGYQVEDLDHPGAVCNGLIGCTPGHPVMLETLEELHRSFRRNQWNIGPVALTTVLRRHPDLMVFPAARFHPYRWDELHRDGETFTDAFTVHHWGASRGGATEMPSKSWWRRLLP